jgi:hypothetical protein
MVHARSGQLAERGAQFAQARRFAQQPIRTRWRFIVGQPLSPSREHDNGRERCGSTHAVDNLASVDVMRPQVGDDNIEGLRCLLGAAECFDRRGSLMRRCRKSNSCV